MPDLRARVSTLVNQASTNRQGPCLAELRDLAGLTQFVAAQRAGISRVRLSLAETNQLFLTMDEERSLRGVLVAAVEEEQKRIEQVQQGFTLGPLAGGERTNGSSTSGRAQAALAEGKNR